MTIQDLLEFKGRGKLPKLECFSLMIRTMETATAVIGPTEV